MDEWVRASELLDRFQRDEALNPADGEKLISEVFRACGHPVSDAGFAESDRGVDLFLETKLDGKVKRISVEVKYSRGPATEESVRQLIAFREHHQIDRSMIVSRSGFTQSALRFAIDNGVGLIDLLSPADLRNWLAKYAPQTKPDTSADLIIRTAMKELARLVARDPGALAKLEWRDLERVLREVFEGLGFGTKLTRSGKDGGFDLELTTIKHGVTTTYLVEVKHWTDQKPGINHLKKLVHVTTSRAATGGLLLSTSGFTRTLYEGLAEISAPVRLGDGGKVVSLCKAYYRLQSAIWIEADDLEATLFEGTISSAQLRAPTQLDRADG